MYDNYQWGKMAERARARACSQIPEEGKKMMMMPDFLPPADDKFEPCVFLAPREIIAEENSVEEAGLRISEFFGRSCFISLRTIHTLTVAGWMHFEISIFCHTAGSCQKRLTRIRVRGSFPSRNPH